MWVMGYKRFMIKSSAVFTLFCFLVSLVLGSGGGLEVQAWETEKGVGSFEYRCPLSIGEVKDSFQGENGKTIIHIQDAHCNYSAQQYIYEIISHFSNEYNIELLCLEGGSGAYDLSVFTDIEDLG